MNLKNLQRIEGHLIVCRDGKGEPLIDVVISPDGLVESKVGTWLMDQEAFEMINARFKEQGNPLPIDYEHATEGGEFGSKDGTAPAAGWMESLRYEKGIGLVASVKWNERAREMIRADEYRFLSPSLFAHKADQRAAILTSAALTNTPAIPRMLRVAAKDTSFHPRKEDTSMEQIKLIAKALGAAETDPVETLVTKIGESKKKSDGLEQIVASARKALGVAEAAGESEIVVAINSLKQSKDAGEDLVKEVASLKAKEAEREVDSLIATHGKGKINPNAAEDLKHCRMLAKSDPEAFKRLMNERPLLVPLEGSKPPAGGAGSDSREQIIAKASKEFDAGGTEGRLTDKGAWINAALYSAGKKGLSKEESEKFGS